MSSGRVPSNTDIQLPSLNQKTIQQWYNKKGKEKDLKILLQGIQLPKASLTGKGAPAPRSKPETLQLGQTSPFQFVCPPDTAGMAKLKIRASMPPPRQVLHRPILPMPSSAAPGPVQLRVILTPPVITPPTMPMIVPTVQAGQKRPSVTDDAVKPKYTRQATSVKCPKCGDDRTPPIHRQYMGYKFCGRTEAASFDKWRAELKERGVARKRKAAGRGTE
ncbi:uncharacterized protein LOC132556359 [Ylistrum balloti]|uniref:uncharacterized protein LOC132556359 n=1 Tax=Ylistrum balloti TaxID=509963 RepID=UPI002905F02A|nr:uncharacterized protein LOC132556359 [Ylistrum balloti]